MDYILPHTTHPNLLTTLGADVATFFTGYSFADTSTPILACAKMAIMSMPENMGFAPSQGVVDDLVRVGAALVVSIISRLVIKLFEPKNKSENANKEKKSESTENKESESTEKK